MQRSGIASRSAPLSSRCTNSSLWISALKLRLHMGRETSPIIKNAIITGHALVGWLYCAALVGIGRQFMSMHATLVVHAVGAPFGFVLVSFFYFKRHAYTSPLRTAFLFLGIVVGTDVFVVALLIEKSFAMFTGILGTWLPFVLIFGATYLTGTITKCGNKQS
jgi:hypothetical protein